MSKKIKLKFAVASLLICFAVFTSYKIHCDMFLTSQNSLLFQNVEALANGESGSGQTLDCWQEISSKGLNQTHKTYCGSCGPKLCTNWYDASTCTN